MLQLLNELTSWNPWRDLERIQWDMSRWLPESISGNRAPVNIYSNGDGLKVVVRIPGWRAEWFDLSVEGNRLELRGEPSKEAVSQDQAAPYFSLKRVINLPYRVKTDNVTANYDNGMLIVDLHRHDQDKPKKIKVAAA